MAFFIGKKPFQLSKKPKEKLYKSIIEKLLKLNKKTKIKT